MLRQSRVAFESEFRSRAAAKIDGGPRERVVHGDDGVAVARDPAAVPESSVESLPERQRRVLRSVVVARLEIADSLQQEVEAGMERELLEEMVVEAGPCPHDDPARAVEPKADAHSCLRSRTQVPGRAFGGWGDRGRSIERPRERRQEQVVVLAVADVEADPVRVHTDDDPRT